jgi:hypothetical protein
VPAGAHDRRSLVGVVNCVGLAATASSRQTAELPDKL